MPGKYRNSFLLLLFCYIFIRNEAHFWLGCVLLLYPFSIISSPETGLIFDLKNSRKWKNVMNEKKVCDDHKILSFNGFRRKQKHIILDIFHKWADIMLQQFASFRFGGNLIRKHFGFTVLHNYFFLLLPRAKILLKGLKIHTHLEMITPPFVTVKTIPGMTLVD